MRKKLGQALFAKNDEAAVVRKKWTSWEVSAERYDRNRARMDRQWRNGHARI